MLAAIFRDLGMCGCGRRGPATPVAVNGLSGSRLGSQARAASQARSRETAATTRAEQHPAALAGFAGSRLARQLWGFHGRTQQSFRGSAAT